MSNSVLLLRTIYHDKDEEFNSTIKDKKWKFKLFNEKIKNIFNLTTFTLLAHNTLTKRDNYYKEDTSQKFIRTLFRFK